VIAMPPVFVVSPLELDLDIALDSLLLIGII
jgi:hypothetical protein